MAQESFATTFGALFTASLSIWFAAWAIRRNLEADKPLDEPAKFMRLIVVVACYGFAAVPSIRSGTVLAWLQVTALVTGLGFLCWPNFAHYITHLFRKDRKAGE